jgi:hypothetical protein
MQHALVHPRQQSLRLPISEVVLHRTLHVKLRICDTVEPLRRVLLDLRLEQQQLRTRASKVLQVVDDIVFATIVCA